MKTITATTTTRRNGRHGWSAAGPLVPAAIRCEVSLPRLATRPAEVVLGELAVDAGGLSHQEAGRAAGAGRSEPASASPRAQPPTPVRRPAL
jgi:hypothetical protein